MSRSFRKIRIDNGTGSDPFLLLQRYRTKLTHDLDVQIAMANTDAGQRNKLFKKWGSLVKFRERSERKIEEKLAQRARTGEMRGTTRLCGRRVARSSVRRANQLAIRRAARPADYRRRGPRPRIA